MFLKAEAVISFLGMIAVVDLLICNYNLMLSAMLLNEIQNLNLNKRLFNWRKLTKN